MIYYIVAVLLYLTYMIFVLMRPQNTTYFPNVLVGMLPLILLIVLRGVVGTDTQSYINIISQIKANGACQGIELGFIYLIKILLFVVNDPQQVCVLVGIITTAVLIISSKSDNRAIFVLIVCIIPTFYLDMTMNGLRYGLSFAFAMLAFSKFYSHNLILSVVLGVVAVLFHISGLFLFLIAALLADDKEELKRWIKLILVLFLVTLVQLYFIDIFKLFMSNINQIGMNNINLNEKYIVYKQYKSPYWFSGLAPMGISLALLYVLQRGNRDFPVLITRHFYILLALVGLMFAIAKFSYAGLRLQTVVLFAMLLMLQFKPGFSGVMNKKVKNGIFFVGCLGLLVFIKGVIQTESQGISPFSPWFINPAIKQLWTFIYG